MNSDVHSKANGTLLVYRDHYLELSDVIECQERPLPRSENKERLCIWDDGPIKHDIFGSFSYSGGVADIIFQENVCQHYLELHLA